MGRGLKVVWHLIGVILAIAYPLGIYAGLRWWSTRAVAVLILVVALPPAILKLRAADGKTRMAVLSAPLTIAILVALTLAFDDPRFILAMPALISLALLATFSATLLGETSMIERYARLIDPKLSEAEALYCRGVTMVWCGFFLLNGMIAAGLAIWAPPSWWALYTGLVAYILMGALFTVEFIVRKARFRRYGTGLHDRVLSRVFPPEAQDLHPQP